MKAFKHIRNWVAPVLASVGAVLLLAASMMPGVPGGVPAVSSSVERVLEEKVAGMDWWAAQALDREAFSLERLPSDMVVYRYMSDTLQSWRHQFPIVNDDISSRFLFQRLSGSRVSMRAPLSEVGEKIAFFNFGPKWYVARSYVRGGCKVVCGLEVMDENDTSSPNGINPDLGLSAGYSIRPISESGGEAVSVDGVPLFKVLMESPAASTGAQPLLVWLSFLFLLSASLVHMSVHGTVRNFVAVTSVLSLAMVALCLWGRSVSDVSRLFSPALYAGGRALYSLGIVLLINLWVAMVAVFLYMARRDLWAKFSGRKSVRVLLGLGCTAVVLICAYAHISLRSIILNSDITLELYKLGSLSVYSVMVYASYMVMLSSLLPVVQVMGPWLPRLSAHRMDVLSLRGCLFFSLALAAYLLLVTSLLGFRKERDRVEVWASRLAVDREVMLEMRLREIEEDISNDAVISALVFLDNAENVIRNRVVDYYLSGFSANYDVSVLLMTPQTEREVVETIVNDHVGKGDPIAEGTRFFFNDEGSGYHHYDGVFLYYNRDYGLVRMLLEVSPKYGRDGTGYMSILGLTPPGRVNLPDVYSFARYRNGALAVFKGDYAYPMEASDDLPPFFVSDGYSHFVNEVAEGEIVQISRPVLGYMNYLICFIILSLLSFAAASLFTIGRAADGLPAGGGYYQTRLFAVLMTSLTLVLVVIASVSVLFVYRRNETNLHLMMSDRINAIQSLVQNRMRSVQPGDDVRSQRVLDILRTVGLDTGADITLYAPDGRALVSTAPQVFDRMILGSRMDEGAFYQIIRKHKRYCIQKESIARHPYYSLYAPVFGPDGSTLGILCSPYAEKSYDLERDAVLHLMTIFSVFIILLILSRFTVKAVLDRMFKPLGEMGLKMSKAGLDTLEHIDYARNDEISALVQAYNRMVDELSESSRRLAQAERDKAWSGMARQVAHEIKNPLTPMKLQIQRIIRLRQKNVSDWQDKFDEVMAVLLDHIDILTDTANEFSTFAKLYTEEPSLIDLDKVLQEEISMFDNDGRVRFDYIGMEGVEVYGPKPQLTRVFVNLITNAVQAVGSVQDGRVMVSLRKSSEDGYYDIVFEDNGPGVAEENVCRLFTPNFTTKNGGSGLGLAISRSVLERCEATISYSRSFTLGGACFLIRYPAGGRVKE